jgi:beta-glucanase (GH16 family)
MGKEPFITVKHFVLLVLGAACLLFAAPAGAVSLLSNPGLESDADSENQTLPGWQTFGANNYNEANPAIAHSGTNYYKVFQLFNGQINDTGIYQDYISGPGAVYNADGWAYTASSDTLAGQNAAWIEVSFRDASGNVLSLYRSSVITTNVIATGAFPKSTWVDLRVTNQCDPSSYQSIGSVKTLVAPPGTFFVRYQVTFQGDQYYSGGSVYFDDLNLTLAGGPPYGNYNIVWSDEFNGSNINANTWTYDIGNGGSNTGWGNSEMEYYTSRTNNVYEAGGCLHIAAKKESYQGFNYTSARIKSEGLFSCTYGRIEWRSQLPTGTGFWPALWMLGTNISTINWPGCGEIDVVENNGSNPQMAQGSIHSGTDATTVYNFTDGNTVTNFHTYTLDWTTNAILFYVDGHLYETQTSWGSSVGSYPFPFNQPFFIIMNLAIGGQYLGYPDTNSINTSVFPGELLVDYVRIYTVTSPLQIAVKKNGHNFTLMWPSNIVSRVQEQTNASLAGLGTNWQQVATTTNQLQVTPASGSGFFRLVSP